MRSRSRAALLVPTYGARSSVSEGQSVGDVVDVGEQLLPACVVTLFEQVDVVVDLDVAVDRRAGTDATWIEADEVEAVGDLGRHGDSRRRDEVDTRSAGATRVEDERADPLVGIARRHAGERDVDRRTVGIVVIERHRRASRTPTRCRSAAGRRTGSSRACRYRVECPFRVGCPYRVGCRVGCRRCRR